MMNRIGHSLRALLRRRRFEADMAGDFCFHIEQQIADLMSRGIRFVFGVSVRDGVIYVAVPLVFVVLGGLASYLPVRRATLVAPAEVLRGDQLLVAGH